MYDLKESFCSGGDGFGGQGWTQLKSTQVIEFKDDGIKLGMFWRVKGQGVTVG